jgi:hypothetical protein
MATLNPIVESPNPVPNGQLGAIVLTFTTDPGTPDLTANVSVYDNGTLIATAPPITLNGIPPEPTPTVSLGSTNSGWEIRADNGVLASTGNNTFTISY